VRISLGFAAWKARSCLAVARCVATAWLGVRCCCVNTAQPWCGQQGKLAPLEGFSANMERLKDLLAIHQHTVKNYNGGEARVAFED
jgi:hypothetical protein